MKTPHSKRTEEGTKAEERVLKRLRLKGIDAKPAPPGAAWDIEAEGKKIEVKAAVRTKHEGSDGHPIDGVVFSNISRDADLYHFIEMDQARDRELTSWTLTGKEVPGVTLTVTEKKRRELPMRSLNEVLSKTAAPAFIDSVVTNVIVGKSFDLLSLGEPSLAGKIVAIQSVQSARKAREDHDDRMSRRTRRVKFRM